VEVLDPIQPGLDKDEFFEQLQREVEGATARLVAEGERELAAGTPRTSFAPTS
jgi:1-acyl-sn-glycerol-3-phosphate acyltransferase